jgi:RNA polymerase sigma-70 factor (ECF subfamily)
MSLAEESDASLVHRLRDGQQQALSVLYDRYAGLVYSLAYKIIQNRQEAEDLTQEIFLTFYNKNSFDPDKGALSTFLILLTRSRAIDKLRREHKKNNFLEQWKKVITEESKEPLPLEKASLQERQEKLTSALAQLPQAQRQVLAMNYYQELSQSQIAKTLNLPLGTVKSRSRQALLQLKKLLSDNQAI